MTYDLSGRLLSAERGGWPVTFTYDGADRVTQSVQNGETINYTYDIPNRIRTVIYPGGRTIAESRDIRSRLSLIAESYGPNLGAPTTLVAEYSYDPGNRVTQRNYLNGTSAAFTYNNNDWVTVLQHSFGAIPIAGFAYGYDNEGNKQDEQKLQDPTHSEAYQYDNIYRLTDYKSGTITHTQYTLDAVGNWPKKVTNGVPEVRTHNAVNEITTINGAPLSYDNNGNLTADSLYTYAYDEENLLTSVMRNSDSRVVGQYQYDAFGRRVQKVANPASPPSPMTTRYFYDDARIIEEQDASGLTQATYVYGNYIDEVLKMNRGGQDFYFHQNALWSVEAITDSGGSVLERYSYDSYGLPSVTDGSGNPIPPNPWGTPHSAIGNPWMFTGRQLDEETGLLFYRARYLDTEKGRFLQRDPIGIWEDAANLGNGYSYVGNNPYLTTDPSGLCTCDGWPWHWACCACKAACWAVSQAQNAACYLQSWIKIGIAACDTVYAGAVAACFSVLVARLYINLVVWNDVKALCFITGSWWMPYCHTGWIDNWKTVADGLANAAFGDCTNNAGIQRTKCIQAIPSLSGCLNNSMNALNNCRNGC